MNEFVALGVLAVAVWGVWLWWSRRAGPSSVDISRRLPPPDVGRLRELPPPVAGSVIPPDEGAPRPTDGDDPEAVGVPELHVPLSVVEPGDFDLPDLDDELLEQSAVRASPRVSPPIFQRLLQQIARHVDAVNVERVDGLVDVEFIGTLPDGNWAWVGERDTWGVVDPGAVELNGVSPDAGDVVRARVEGWPWGYRITSVAPATLRPGGERVAVQPTASGLRREGWQGGLRPGDLIVARVSYSPHSLPGADGSMSKVRPAVFMGWSGEHALVRGIFTNTKDRYVSRHRPIALSPEKDLHSTAVAVRDRSVEIPAERIVRRIGTLSEVNRGRLGIGGRPGAARPPSRKTFVVPVATWRAGPVPLIGGPPVSAEVLNYVGGLVADKALSTWADVTLRVLLDISGRQLFDVDDKAVTIAEIGGVLSAIANNRPDLGTRPKRLAEQVRALCSSNHQLATLVVKKSNHTQPADLIARVGTDTPLSGMSTTIDDPSRFEITWDTDPAVVIYDQSWSHGHLGDRRVNLRNLIEAVTGSAKPSAFLIGPCIPEVASFHRVAEHLGWRVVCAESRTDEIAAARRLARMHGDGPVVVVTHAVDMVRELEDDGHDLHIIDDLTPFWL